MRVLIIVPNQDRISGNWVSAERFQRGLEGHGHQVILQATDLQAQDRLRQGLIDCRPDVTLLLHAYRSGKPWLEAASGLGIPCVVLLTGTDVNHGLDNDEQGATIRTVLQRAACVLLQNSLIIAELSVQHPELTANLHWLSPGITLGTAPYDLRKTHDLRGDQTLFLCPTGLRPIKGVMELLRMFDRMEDASSAYHLAICGPILDAEYGRDVLAALARRPWASYLGTIPAEAMASAMLGADVIVNNSQTEGLANTLLEAATLGIPILAHDIPGNAAVVSHELNGLLYAGETQFTLFARQLLDRGRRRQLTCPDPHRYDPEHETTALIGFLHEAIKTTGSGL